MSCYSDHTRTDKDRLTKPHSERKKKKTPNQHILTPATHAHSLKRLGQKVAASKLKEFQVIPQLKDWAQRTDCSVKISSHWDANPNRIKTKSLCEQTHYAPKGTVSQGWKLLWIKSAWKENLWKENRSNNWEVLEKRALDLLKHWIC